MSKLPELTLTKAGAALLAKTPIGSEIPVTKWRIGDGQLPGGEEPRDRTQLVHPVRELPIASVENDGNQCLIKGQLVNSEMEAFTWRETGLYATDPDDGEILYAYGYEADGAEIPAGATQLREIEFGVELVFDNAANVTAVISKTLVFASLADLDQTKNDAVAEALEQITTSQEAEDLTDSDAFATVTAAGIQRTPLSLLKQIFGKLFAPAPLTQNLTLYVNADTGSDSNDGLDAGRAKQTIMAAINSLPKNLGGNYVDINISPGTYTENVSIFGFFNGGQSNREAIRFLGDSNNPIIIGEVAVNAEIAVYIYNVEINGVVSAYGGTLHLGKCKVSRNTSTAIFAIKAKLIMYDTAVTNTGGNGVLIGESTAYIFGISGNVSGVGITAGYDGGGTPGIVVVSSNSIAAGTKYNKVRGGVIIENGVLV